MDVLELTYGVMTRAGKDFWSSSLEGLDELTGGSTVSDNTAPSNTNGKGGGSGGGGDAATTVSVLDTTSVVTSTASGSNFVFKVRAV